MAASVGVLIRTPRPPDQVMQARVTNGAVDQGALVRAFLSRCRCDFERRLLRGTRGGQGVAKRAGEGRVPATESEGAFGEGPQTDGVPPGPPEALMLRSVYPLSHLPMAEPHGPPVKRLCSLKRGDRVHREHADPFGSRGVSPEQPAFGEQPEVALPSLQATEGQLALARQQQRT